MRYPARLLSICTAFAMAVPPSGTMLLTTVGDAETGAFLPDAEVSVRGEKRVARTDSMGQARFPGIAEGVHTIDVRRVGYALLSTPVKVTGRDSIEVVFMMRP